MNAPTDNGDGAPQPKQKFIELQMKVSDPLILDRWVDVAYAIFWFLYGLWGIITLTLGLPTISQFAPDWYQAAWSGAIGLLSITASILATLTFFKTPWMRQVTKKYLERTIVYPLTIFISVYPVLLFLRSIDGDALLTAGASALAVSYVVFPILRIHILSKRIEAMREVLLNASGTR